MKNDILEIEFTKIEGAGNDFVLIDNRSENIKFGVNELAKMICERHSGIGADGLIIIENSTEAEFKMRYINSDGSEGGMCGNGGRCAAQFVLLENPQNCTVKFEALNNIYKAERTNKNIKLWMQQYSDLTPNIKIRYQNEEIKINYINTGAPHVVIMLSELPNSLRDSLYTMDINTIGRYIRYHSKFAPLGTNVNFVEEINKQKIAIRTYERGVENETLACGTGAVASAILSAIKFEWHSPIEIFTKSKNKLIVHFNIAENNISDVALEGPAKVVFKGKFKYSQLLKQIVQ